MGDVERDEAIGDGFRAILSKPEKVVKFPTFKINLGSCQAEQDLIEEEIQYALAGHSLAQQIIALEERPKKVVDILSLDCPCTRRAFESPR